MLRVIRTTISREIIDSVPMIYFLYQTGIMDPTQELIELTEQLMKFAPRIYSGDKLINYLQVKFPEYRKKCEEYLALNSD